MIDTSSISDMKNEVKRCYNTYSCILSVLIIIFIIGSILFDMFVTKPAIRKNIQEIRVELTTINKKLTVVDSLRAVKFNELQEFYKHEHDSEVDLASN